MNRYLLLTIAGITVMTGNQSIKVVSLENEAIYLLPFTSRDFQSALDAKRPRDLDDLLPYAVLMKNATDRNIIAWAIRWTCTDAESRTVASDITYNNFDTLKPADGIPAHASRLVSVVAGLGTAGSPSGEGFQSELQQLLTFYRKYVNIVISIEAVLFQDGSSIGEDRNNAIPRLQAMLDAERDVADDILRTPGSRESLNHMREVALASMSADLPRDPSQFAIAAYRAKTYDESYLMMKAFFAHQFLNIVRSRGEQVATEALRSRMLSRQYPRFNRKEIKQ